MNWTFAPDQFALAWAHIDGDRIPYPLAVRLSARNTTERAAQLPELNLWCDRVLDADMEAALRVLARPELRVEVFGQRQGAAAAAIRSAPAATGSPVARQLVDLEPGRDAVPHNGTLRPVRVLGAVAGSVAVVAAQRAGATKDRGGAIRMFVGSTKSLSTQVISMLPENVPGAGVRLTAPLSRVEEDSRDLVTVPVAGPSIAARIRTLLHRPRDGIGQLVVSVRRGDGEFRPFGVLCWIDVAGDGRYAVRTGADVDIAPVTAQTLAAQLRPMLHAAETNRTGGR